MPIKKPTMFEWLCTNCGRKARIDINTGRPVPSDCLRSPRGGLYR